MMIPGWAIDMMQAEWVASWAGSSDGPRTRERWQRSMDTALKARWQDPTKRPQQPVNGNGATAPTDHERKLASALKHARQLEKQMGGKFRVDEKTYDVIAE